VLYRDTPPGGEVPPSSTIAISIVVGTTRDDTWQERVSLVHAKPDEACFAVETDELGRTAIRFGTGDHGRALPDDAHVIATWQGGDPLAGNVGAGAIAVCAEPTVIRCWNPFDVTNARVPEPRDQIVRRAPELYRTRQLRGVTLADIVARAEEVPGVARAAARYVWTGSWTAVRLAIDPAGTDVLDDELRRRVAEYLAPIILIGDDLELRAARYVPVEVIATVCISPEAWPEHVRGELLDELSDGFTADGRRGLFHPDAWTFGQSLHASQIIGRIQAVAGVAHVTRVELRRYREPTPGAGDAIEVAAHEIIQVRNDPDDMERGSIELQLVGGRA
jgi:predicted phage baseplate assembly protein